MSNSEARALPYFTDTLGRPLESGKIYIGQAGLDPIANPQTVYSDTANTIVLQQPIRTLHGHAVSGGAYVHLFCTTPYSITVMDSSGRVNYTSLNESDPNLTNTGTIAPQTADSLDDLRARSAAASNQVMVSGYGMYIQDATDTTSPESVPRIIVADDGTRYKLLPEYLVGTWVQLTGVGSPIIPGAHVSYNDDGSGAAFLTANRGALTGGVVLRTMSADGLTEVGRVTISPAGDVTSSGVITANGNLVTRGNTVALVADGSRALTYDGQFYNLGGANLKVNGSLATTLAATQGYGIGGITLTSGAAPSNTGTWASLATVNGVTLWVRTA